MAYPPYIPFILTLLSLLTFSSSNSNPETITLSLSPLFTKSSSSDLLQTLKSIASTSLTRAHHLKTHKSKHNSPSPSPINTPILSKSYGGYSIDLKFGTPPQTSSFILDTGSSLVWFPCSSRYLCSNCNFPNINPTKIPTFIPKNSSTSKLLGCTNSKCGWLFFGSDVQSRCRGCNPQTQNCNFTCPAYIVQYGLGSTAGFLLLDNLDLPGKTVPDFLVGCSILSTRQPSGIAGFGRGLDSLPSQMGLKRFSYCLLSHRFDDSPENSDLVLQTTSTGDTKSNGLSYTKFSKNPFKNNTAFLEYYYLSLRKIIVGGERVKIPVELLEPSSGNGNGGTIVDSGSTFTFMERPIFELVSREFEKQLANFTRAKEVEEASGLGLCFEFAGVKTVPFPELSFQFKGGAKMTLPISNYFSLVGDSKVACLTIVSDGIAAPASGGGPAIILGNYQQQDYYVEYDLENDRFGFRPQSCKKSV